MLGPVAHHAHTFFPILSACVGAAHGIVVAMRKLTLDCVGMPKAHFVEQGRRHGPEAMPGHLMLGISQSP